jgi:hypothetical protein
MINGKHSLSPVSCVKYANYCRCCQVQVQR